MAMSAINGFPSLRECASSPCLAFALLSKAIHFHFHYSFETFTWRDAVFLPTFFAYDALACIVVCSCLAYRSLRTGHGTSSATDKEKPPITPRASTSMRKRRWVFQYPLNFLGVVCLLAIGLCVATELAVYITMGGLCSWPTVIEAYSRPSYLAIFWSQWMNTTQTLFVLVVPVCMWIYALVFQNLVHRVVRHLSHGFSKQNAVRLLLASAVCFAIQSFVRPWLAAVLLCLWTWAWLTAVYWLFHTQEESASTSTAAMDPRRTSNVLPVMSAKREGPQHFKAAIKKRPYLTLAVTVVLLWCVRSRAFDDISVTVPASVLSSILGVTDGRCPVGKPWPEIPTSIRSDTIPCSDADCDASNFLHALNLTAYWDPHEIPAGFEMFSPQRQAQWGEWARTKGSTTPPLGYHFLFDDDKISNLERPLLPDLLGGVMDEQQDLLSKAKIRNVAFILFESTAVESFPMTPDSVFYQRTINSRHPGKVYDDIEMVTPNAAKLFNGSYAESAGDGSRRGGLSVKGASTSVSYTLKSQMASHCGLSPLPMDFMREVVADAHAYQPCLAHILHALNDIQAADRANQTWKLLYAQAVDERWDRNLDVIDRMGFDLESEVIVKGTLADANAPYPVPRSQRKTVRGEWFFPETVLDPYFRDFWRAAKRKGQRSFLSHITSSSHYPWPLPADWPTRRYGEDVESNQLLNAMAYQDAWLGQMFSTMREEGILDETLVVLSSDHGIALQEGDLRATLQPHNSHINNFAVPLLFHHSSLPFFELPANATSMHILPTILDILLNSASDLVPSQREFLRMLLPSYEGQSLIRPLKFTSPPSPPPLNFALPSPGRGYVIVTSPDSLNPWRLSLPLCHHGTFSATNVADDRHEEHPERALDWSRFLRNVRKRWGEEAAEWMVEAERRAGVWAREVGRRWGVDPKAPPGEMIVRFTATD